MYERSLPARVLLAAAIMGVATLTIVLMAAVPAVAQEQRFPTQQLERPGGDFSGDGLEVDGDTTLAGFSVYTFDGTDWQLDERLAPPPLPEPTSEGNFALRGFARDVAISGDTAVVTGSFVIPVTQGGVAEARPFFATYESSGSSWELRGVTEVDIPAVTGSLLPNLIDDIDISGDTVVVGDTQSDRATRRGGAVLTYTKSGDTFTQTTRLVPEEIGRFSDFGSEVAVEGTTIVVGDKRDRSVSSSNGAAYVFENGALVEKLTAPEPTFLAEFGKTLDIEDDTIAVGSGEEEGRAFLFGRDTGGANQWGLERQFAVPDKQGSLGATNFDVAISGPRVILGTTGLDSDGQLAPGTVYQFDRSASDQDSLVAQLVLRSDNGYPRFGVPVALGGDQALVAAPNLGNRGGVLAYTLE